jgi:hypothetical protein
MFIWLPRGFGPNIIKISIVFPDRKFLFNSFSQLFPALKLNSKFVNVRADRFQELNL